MPTNSSSPAEREPIDELLAEAQRTTREQVAAVWQLQMDRVHEALSRDWREQIARIVDQRFADLEQGLRPRIARERLEIVRGLAQHLNECFARMRAFESDRHWCDALLDAAAGLSRRSAFFSIRGRGLCFQGSRGVEGTQNVPVGEFEITSAPAFCEAAQSMRIVETARTAQRLSPALAAFLGEAPDATAALLPLKVEDRVAGILYAEDPVETSALETVVTFATASLELRLLTDEPARQHVVRPAAHAQTPEDAKVRVRPALPAIVDPSRLRAEQFARARVAQILLANSGAVHRGRADRNLYGALRGQIDSARTAYGAQFPGERDALHEELVRTLAQGDAELLGGGYPGPLE